MKEYLQHPPMDWKDFKHTLMRSLRSGIDQKNLPSAFYVPRQLWEIYESIQEARTPDEDRRFQEKHRKGELTAVETIKTYVEHMDGSLVIVTPPSESNRSAFGGVIALAKRVSGEFGSMHNHPWDNPASAHDLVALIARTHLIMTVVTPLRIHTVLRTKQLADVLPDFHFNEQVARAYLMEMGRKKGFMKKLSERDIQLLDEQHNVIAPTLHDQQSWTVNDESLGQLGLARFEASRHTKRLLFERKV